MINYIKETLSKQKMYLLHKRIPIQIIHSLPKHIDIKEVIKIIEDKISHTFFIKTQIESILIGQFKHLIDRNIQASYEGGTIYLSNHENNLNITEIQLAKDITHELAHAVHDFASLSIFGDGALESEFLSKRRALGNLLELEGYDIQHYDFHNVEYDERFDEFLFREVGYDELSTLTIGLFDSPYSATSIYEYYSNGFEDYFFGDIAYMKNISKELYNRVRLSLSYLKE